MKTRAEDSKKNGTWLVTGANRGIGLAFARELATRGQRVIGTARQPDKASDLAAAGARVEGLDVADFKSISRLASGLQGERIDVLIHNAGTGDGANSVAEIEPAEIEHFFRVNVIGPMLLTRALLPNLEPEIGDTACLSFHQHAAPRPGDGVGSGRSAERSRGARARAQTQQRRDDQLLHLGSPCGERAAPGS